MTQNDSFRSAGEPNGIAPELEAARADLLAAQREVDAARAALAASRDRERRLAHELQHRVRNMLAVIRSIYRRTREVEGSQEEFAEHFQGRLDAVARYHVRVSETGSPGMDLEDMLRDELLGVQCCEGSGCVIGGPQVRLSGKSAELMALAIHELITNSIKFGALAQDGSLAVEWALSDGGAQLRFRWTESDISLISSAPRSSGFGRELIEEGLPYQLGATTSVDFRPGGMECSILLPLSAADGPPDDPGGATTTNMPLPSADAERI